VRAGHAHPAGVDHDDAKADALSFAPLPHVFGEVGKAETFSPTLLESCSSVSQPWVTGTCHARATVQRSNWPQVKVQDQSSLVSVSMRCIRTAIELSMSENLKKPRTRDLVTLPGGRGKTSSASSEQPNERPRPIGRYCGETDPSRIALRARLTTLT
jgi:hypothetical protein